MVLLNLDGNWTKRSLFALKELLEAAGSHTGFQTSKADTDTPVSFLSTVVNPDTLIHGVITQIRIKLNWANAVTLEALRLWSDAQAGDYESNALKLFDSDEYITSLNNDEEYVFNVYIPFILATAGKMFYAPQWSGACGNIQGHVTVKGEVWQ